MMLIHMLDTMAVSEMINVIMSLLCVQPDFKTGMYKNPHV